MIPACAGVGLGQGAHNEGVFCDPRMCGGRPWFRFYSDALDNPKVQRLPGELFKAWVNILCLANRAQDRGALPCVEDIGFALRITDEKAAEVVAELRRRGLLEEVEGRLEPHDWEPLQPESDTPEAAAARKRRQRSREKQSESVSPESHSDSHADVPLQKENRGEEREIRIEQNPPGVALAREAPEPEVVVPGDVGAKVIPFRPPGAAELPFAGQDWEGRTHGAAVLREWIRLQPVPPGPSDRDRFGRTCKRIADEHTVGEIALAFVGMRYTWPHAERADGTPGEAWTPEHLLKRFAEALANARQHPQFVAQREAAELEEEIVQRRHGRPW